MNGKLFRNRISLADFDEKMRKTLIDCCRFDWSQISPAIFGSMFQGILDKKKRRELGAHYTDEKNILKLINPLFMDDLWDKFERIKTNKSKLEEFHVEISQLQFFDPACGCGNFLMLAYRELRRLEHGILEMLYGNIRQRVLDVSMRLKVTVEQFYGIEIEDFPCEIARVGMWLTDHQMNQELTELFGYNFARLPLTEGATILHDNALRIDWNDVLPKEKCSYLLGNPPFVGAKYQESKQRDDVKLVFAKMQNVGLLDYVSCWYFTAAKYIKDTAIQVGFVSTNSITQGEQVGVLWPLLFNYGVKINFCYTTFIWTSEAKGKAHVHCVIIGFSAFDAKKSGFLRNRKKKSRPAKCAISARTLLKVPML